MINDDNYTAINICYDEANYIIHSRQHHYGHLHLLMCCIKSLHNKNTFILNNSTRQKKSKNKNYKFPDEASFSKIFHVGGLDAKKALLDAKKASLDAK